VSTVHAPASPAAPAAQQSHTLLFIAAAAGLGALAAGIAVDQTRGLTALLAAGFLAVAAAMGPLAILALCQVANAGFHAAFKRVLEALACALPVGAAALLALLPFAGKVWKWARHGALADKLVAAKAAYLNLPLFALRMVLFLAVWMLFAFLLRRESRAQDADGDVRHTKKGVVYSALFILFGGYSIGLASVDWLMSTDPHWASTIYGFYTIAVILQTGAAVTILAVTALRRAGRLPEVNENHLHDLGKLLFAFSTLWAYLWFSQYLLIWYANLPEETSWFLLRTANGYAPYFYGNLVLNWVLPFLLLLPRPAKRNQAHLIRVAWLVMAGRLLDIWLQCGPSNLKHAPLVPWVEVGAAVGVLAVFALVYRKMLEGAPLVARHDPYIEESLHHWQS
jgi:hypothetical protein